MWETDTDSYRWVMWETDTDSYRWIMWETDSYRWIMWEIDTVTAHSLQRWIGWTGTSIWHYSASCTTASGTIALQLLVLLHYSFWYYSAPCTLWSSSQMLLKIPKHNFISFGDHSFGFDASSVRNALPASLQKKKKEPHSEFKTQLKTVLFRQAFWQSTDRGVK